MLKNVRLTSCLCGLVVVSLLAACGGSGNPGNPQPPGNNTPGNNNTDPNNPANNNTDPNNPANNTTGNNAPEADPFAECGAGLSACGGGTTCQDGVCVITPGGDAEIRIGYERSNSVHPVDSAPSIDCYAEAVPLGDDVAYVEMRGRVEKFGPGGSTQGLCVTVYNGERFLEDVLMRCDSVDPSDFAALEECYEVDPCRCEAGDDACLLEIGYCSAIGSAGMKATCEQAWAFDGTNPNRDAGTESTLIYGHMTSTAPPEDPESTEGYFAIPNVPTHTPLVIKVSGRKARWIDTYEYGPILSEIRDDAGTAWSPWGGNVISIGAWNTIPSTALVPAGIQDGNGAVAGRINDCGAPGRMTDVDGQTYDVSAPLPIENATVNLAHDGTRLSYFNGNPEDTLPQPSRTTTNVLAVYAGVDVPGGPNTVANVGRLNGELVELGTRRIFLPPRAVAIATFEGNFTPATW